MREQCLHSNILLFKNGITYFGIVTLYRKTVSCNLLFFEEREIIGKAAKDPARNQVLASKKSVLPGSKGAFTAVSRASVSVCVEQACARRVC